MRAAKNPELKMAVTCVAPAGTAKAVKPQTAGSSRATAATAEAAAAAAATQLNYISNPPGQNWGGRSSITSM